MSNGIAHNNLNDISKIYLETISDINKKEQEDDVKRWQQEESECGQNTRQQSPFKKKKVKAYKEAFSNWRTDLREVTSDAEAVEVDDEPEIKEKKVKNKIKINPEFKEAVKQMGGELLEVKEVDSPDGEVKDDKKAEQDELKKKKISDKERKLKMRILRVKMMATKQDAGASIVAGYEPDIEGAVEYFYEEGINEEGIEQLVEEIGLDEFVNFIEGGTVELNEERAARRASVRAKKYDVVKKEVDAADAARRKSKKGEYSSAYKKKETDVTVYDNKVSKKKTVKKTVKKTETVKKPVTKKVVKAVAKVKKTQPAKKASKPGIRQKISTFYKRGVERHKKAREAGRVPEKRAKEFASGVKSGVKTAVKFAKDVKKVVSKEELEILEAERKLADRLARKRKVYDKTTKKAMQFARDEGEASGHARYRMSSISREMDGIKAKMKKEEVEVQEKVLDKFETGEKERIVKGMKKDSKGLKKRYGDKWKNVMYATATKRAKEAGDTSKSDKRYAHEEVQIEEKKKGLDGKACWKGYRLAGTKKKGGKTVDNCVKEDKALAMVKAAIIKKHGKGAIYDGKSKPKPPSDAEKAKASAERKKRQDADNKAYAGRAKKAGFKSTQDYTNVVARYGSEDNYKKGKGLGT